MNTIRMCYGVLHSFAALHYLDLPCVLQVRSILCFSTSFQRGATEQI